MAHSRNYCIVAIIVSHKGDFVGNLDSNARYIHLILLRFKEDSEKGHWYPDVLKNPAIESFLDKVTSNEASGRVITPEFTLTVTNPQESDSLRGWRVHHLKIPGR